MAGIGTFADFRWHFCVLGHESFLVNLHAKARSLRGAGVALFVDGPADLRNVARVVPLAAFVNEEKRDARPAP